MATAKSTAKKKTKAAVSALFAGNVAPKAPKSSKSKPRDRVELPEDLRPTLDVVAAWRNVKDALEKKAKVAEQRIAEPMLKSWCERYADSGKMPSMTTFEGEQGSIDFVMTRRVSLNAAKMEALDMMGVDISEWVETTGVDINMDAVVRLGLLDKLQEAIANLVEDEAHIAEIFQPKVAVKEGFLEALPSLAEGKGPLKDRLYGLVSVLKPVSQLKNGKVDELSREECFKLVDAAKLPAKDK